MYSRGMLDKTHWKHPKKSPVTGISRESLALLNWTISKLSGMSPQKERSNTFVGSSTSSEGTLNARMMIWWRMRWQSGTPQTRALARTLIRTQLALKVSLCNPIATFAKIVENVNLQFVNEFNDVYKRNNKKGGIKSLRCFPLCKEFGHSKSNYCGRTLALNSNNVSKKHLCNGHIQLLPTLCRTPCLPPQSNYPKRPRTVLMLV